ncbi:hypothetical protein PCE1_003842 [Barthelona sp. PCE]
MEPVGASDKAIRPVKLVTDFVRCEKFVQVLLVNKTRLIGKLIGFDEFMSLTLGDCYLYDINNNSHTHIGTTLLKGDNVVGISECPEQFLPSD